MNSSAILEGLNTPQIEAVQHIDGPLLVVAGAGSGKTRAITRRIAYLISQGVAPTSIVAITFTNKAAGEMLSRVRETLTQFGLAQRGGSPTVATFHAFSAMMLRIHGQAIGVDPNFSIYDTADRTKLIKAACGDAGALPVGLTPMKIGDRISAAKSQLISPENIATMPGVPEFHRPFIQRAYQRYQQMLTENGGMDFDDLLIRMLALLENETSGTAIRNRYRYLLIDEYQDTNRIQYLIARALVSHTRNINATGDPDQAIYGWRGADIRNILEFQEDYPDAHCVMLEQNYRSTATILQAADSVIRLNTKRKPKKLVPVREAGSPVEVHSADDEVEEAKTVVNLIQQAKRDGLPMSEMAVFCRVNSLMRHVEEALVEAGIPYEVARGTGFYQRREIKDIVAYLRVLVNPDDQISLERIINVPARGIGAQAQELLLSTAKRQHITLREIVDNAAQIPELGKSQSSVIAFSQLLDKLLEIGQTVHLSEFIRQTIEVSGLREYYRKLGDKDQRPDELSPVANLEEFVSSAQSFEDRSEEPTLTGFLSQVSLVSDIDAIEGQTDRVTLLTMHAAKGLEFDMVTIIGMEEEIIPHMLSLPDGVEEERRLFFVGMTRARKRLHLCYAHSRATRGSHRRTVASRFLREIDPQVVRGLNLSEIERPARNFQFVINPKRSEPIFAEDESRPKCPYRSGQRVYHQKFGHGVIEEIHLSGGHHMGSIRFHTAGMRKIALDIAPLQAVGTE